MTIQRDSLARWMTPETSDAAVERMWSRIAEADERSSRRVLPWAVGFGVAVAAVAVAFMVWPSTKVLQVGAPLAAEMRPTEARFNDGSQVTVAQGGTVELINETPAEMRVKLSSGVATFEVAKRPTRHFIVQADGVEVRVVGTRFTVRHEEEEVNVAVERGIVEVVTATSHVRLTAGQSWSSRAQAAAVVPAPVVAPSAAAAEEVAAVDMPAAPEAVRERVASPKHVAHREASHGASHGQSVAPAAGGGGSGVTREPTETAAQLFQSALTARREARFSDAALALERILRDHSDDSRAALAAFELGRLRMDSLPDLRGATEALELSLVLSPKAQFAEEALLRLVKAYDARGLPGPCVHVRDDYLTRFPNGTYIESVKGYCRR